MDVEFAPRINIQDNHVNSQVLTFTKKYFEWAHLAGEYSHRCFSLTSTVVLQSFGPTVTLHSQPQSFVYKVNVDRMLSWLEERLYPDDELKYVSPSVLTSSSSSSILLSSGAEVLLRLDETEIYYNQDTETVLIFLIFLLKALVCMLWVLCVFTSSRFAELWAGSGAARWPPVAHPGLSAASSCCAPVGRSPPQPHPSVSSGPSYADSTTRKKQYELNLERFKINNCLLTYRYWTECITYLVLLILHWVLFFFNLHHHLFYLSL